jgi:hypothetical protein
MEFEELDPRAKSNAISKYGDPPDDWYESVYAQYIGDKELEAKGMCIESIHYSGFYSQGDGASWSGRVNLDGFIEHHVKPEHPDAGRYMVLLALMHEHWVGDIANIHTTSFMYVHSGCMKIEGVQDISASTDADANASVFEHGIFQGASVRDLARGIDLEGLVNDLEEWVLTEAKSLADEIYIALRDEYEHYTSEETFNELIYINGWRFDSKGNLLTEEEVSHGI